MRAEALQRVAVIAARAVAVEAEAGRDLAARCWEVVDLTMEAYDIYKAAGGTKTEFVRAFAVQLGRGERSVYNYLKLGKTPAANRPSAPSLRQALGMFRPKTEPRQPPTATSTRRKLTGWMREVVQAGVDGKEVMDAYNIATVESVMNS